MAPRGKPRKSASPVAKELIGAERSRKACPQAQCCLPRSGGFDGLLLRAVRDYAREHGSKVRSFNTTLLKSPVMKQGFKSLMDAFHEADVSNTGALNIEETKEALKRLHWDMPPERVDSLFKQADVRNSKDIDRKEFALLAILVVLLEGGAPGTHGSQLEEAISIAVDTFVFFDTEGRGRIRKKDVARAVCSSPHSPTHEHTLAVGNLRFDELNWTRQGEIGFPQFMYQFFDWVDLSEEDASEEQKQAEMEAINERRKSLERRSMDEDRGDGHHSPDRQQKSAPQGVDRATLDKSLESPGAGV